MIAFYSVDHACDEFLRSPKIPGAKSVARSPASPATQCNVVLDTPLPKRLRFAYYSASYRGIGFDVGSVSNSAYIRHVTTRCGHAETARPPRSHYYRPRILPAIALAASLPADENKV